MSISKITPILIVDSVEKTLPFWRDQLGYVVAHTVPHENTVGFAILKSGNSELMLQSSASLTADLKLSEDMKPGTVILYADVESLDQAMKANEDGKVLISKRTTAYGAKESWVKTPSGAILGLAEFS